jgi:hypothetical protein
VNGLILLVSKASPCARRRVTLPCCRAEVVRIRPGPCRVQAEAFASKLCSRGEPLDYGVLVLEREERA